MVEKNKALALYRKKRTCKDSAWGKKRIRRRAPFSRLSALAEPAFSTALFFPLLPFASPAPAAAFAGT
jgi:hypothetical protein